MRHCILVSSLGNTTTDSEQEHQHRPWTLDSHYSLTKQAARTASSSRSILDKDGQTDASEGGTVSYLVLWASVVPTMINKCGAGKISHSPPKVNRLQVVEVETLSMALMSVFYPAKILKPHSKLFHQDRPLITQQLKGFVPSVAKGLARI